MDFAALLMLLGLAAPPDQLPLLPPPALTTTSHPQNPALRPLRQQAEAGNADAQFNLGIAWINGSAGTVNYDQARYWWEKAAAQGQRIAQYNLGVLYDEGRGVSQDYHLAAQWYRKAAQQGFISAQYNLGNLYRDGKGVPQNAYIARDWQEKAAAQGDRDAMYALGSLYQQGSLGISGDGQHALAFYWLEQAAMRGHPQAQAELAGLYARGEGVVRDPAIAAKWQRAAATAQTGTENTDNSDLTAIEQTEQAAMHGDTQAQVALANHYALGDGIACDVEAALKWWQVAAAQGSTDAMQALARHYRDAADRSQAEHWYLAAAEKGDSSAYRELGQIYADARPPDYTTARKYWHAGKKGDPVAQYLIGKSHSDWREPGNPNAAHNAFSGFLQHCHEDENPPADYCADAAYLTALIEQHKLPGYQPPQPNEVRQHWQEAAYWGHPVARAWLETAPAPPGATPPARITATAAAAQYQLSWHYATGDGIAQNRDSANHWLRQAAQNGHAAAQYWLGNHYYDDTADNAQDETTARYWLEQAATRGDRDLQKQTGMTYLEHDDYHNARRWLRQLADHGDRTVLPVLEMMNDLQRGRVTPLPPPGTVGNHPPAPAAALAENTATPWPPRHNIKFWQGENPFASHAKTFKERQKRALAGDWLAQIALGDAWYKGETGKKDARLAHYWWRKSQTAYGQDSYTLYNLGVLYDSGEGVARNPQRAAQYYTAAARLNDNDARYNLAHLYHYGDGVPRSDIIAHYWLTKAATHERDAMTALGMLYQKSGTDDGTQMRASYWLEQAAMRGDAQAQYELFWRSRYGYGIEKNQETANRWLQQAAENGNVEAQYRLGVCYYNGCFAEFRQDKRIGREWLEKAAAQGDSDMRFLIGMEYFFGSDYDDARRWLQPVVTSESDYASMAVSLLDTIDRAQDKKRPAAPANTAASPRDAIAEPPRDPATEAAEWQRRAEAGDARAQYQLYFRYSLGDGVKQDQETANRWLQQAAGNGDADAQYWLGERYYDGGSGFGKDRAAAFMWLEKAAAQGGRGEQSHVGWRYYSNGDYDNARRWLQKAADQGDSTAKFYLKKIDGLQHAKRPPAPDHSAAPPRDAVAATAELQRRAEAGDTGAQGLLPCYYAEPNGARAEYRRQCDAAQGNATAQTRLGRQYYDSGDIAAARHWLQQAADGGSFVVPDLLMIQTGQCFKDIYPVFEAFDTLRQRAKAGDATAQYRLSLRHLAGVHQNRREADYWLQQAAENGDLDAQYWLGQHYYHGSRGFPKDPKTAHQWLDKAAAAGGRDTRYQVGMTYFSSGEYTTARYWLQRAAAQGNPQAPSVLRAIDALTAETTPPAAALRQAAEAGSASAQYQLALRYRKGEGVAQNPTEADYWLRRAAEQEHEDAQIALALRYYDNLAGAKYHKTATMPWLEKAGTKGDAARQYQVGMIYLEHDNRVDARRWLSRAAERGDVAAAAALQLLETEYRAKRYAPSAANTTQSP
ncbi:MAG: sel1 repeat family protein [Cardiobacterium sp.]|nr:MAG: sel1 repeat family protein [Cardiobacterium sp.]